MHISNYCNQFCDIQIGIDNIEQDILQTQAKIYVASRACQKSNILKEQKYYLSNRSVFLLITKNAIKSIKKNRFQGTYHKKILLLSYFALFTSSICNFNGLRIIKSKVVKDSTVILLKPEWEARNEAFSLISRLDGFINFEANHINKMMWRQSSCDDTCSIVLKLCKRVNKNIDTKAVLRLLDPSLNFFNEINLLLDNYLFEKIVCTGLDWHLYTNVRAGNLYRCLYLAKKRNTWFSLYSPLYSRQAIKYLSGFLDALKVNLKSVKCIICKCIKQIVHLQDIECIVKNGLNCLIKPSRQATGYLIRELKKKLYHKNAEGYWRANAYICASTARLQLKKILSSWQIYHLGTLVKSEAAKINKIADYIFYRWQIK